MIHHAKSIEMPFGQKYLYDIAQDVENYPKFLPNCVAARIREKRSDYWVCENVYRWGPISHKFTTHTTLIPYQSIDVHSVAHDPVQLHVQWRFLPREKNTCLVEIDIRLSTRLHLLEKASKTYLKRSAKGIEYAFEKRAFELAKLS